MKILILFFVLLSCRKDCDYVYKEIIAVNGCDGRGYCAAILEDKTYIPYIYRPVEGQRLRFCNGKLDK